MLTKDGDLTELSPQDFLNEDESLLARYPALLAGQQITPEAPRLWLLVKREAALSGVAAT